MSRKLDQTPCEICGRPIVWAGGSRQRHLNAHVDRGEATSYLKYVPGNLRGGYYVYIKKEK